MAKIRIYFIPAMIKEEILLKDRDIIHKVKDVLRLKKDDSVFVFDGEGKEYEYIIEEIRQRSVEIKRIRKIREDAPSQVKVSLAFPLLREQKLNFILQKAVELGVCRLLPFFSQHSAVFHKPSQVKRKRWQKIVIEAVRQSQRLWVPFIEPVREFDEVLMEAADVKLFAHVSGRNMRIIEKADRGGGKSTFLLVVGPEGDFSDEERGKLVKHGFQCVKLSESILRSETACVFFVGLVNYLYG